MSSADVGQVARQGGHADILNFVRDSQRQAYFEGRPFRYDDIREQVERMGPNDVDMHLLRFVSFFNRGPASYDVLKEYASRLVYVHDKFCDIDETARWTTSTTPG